MVVHLLWKCICTRLVLDSIQNPLYYDFMVVHLFSMSCCECALHKVVKYSKEVKCPLKSIGLCISAAFLVLKSAHLGLCCSSSY